MNETTRLALVMSVPLIVWAGVFAYLLHIDRMVRGLESRSSHSEDDL